MLVKDPIVRKSDSAFNYFIFKNFDQIPPNRKLQIMMIDDTRKDIELFNELLLCDSNLQFTLTSWTNSNEAIFNLEMGRIRPHVIILDLVMPCMHGKIILKRLKGITLVKSIPVIIHSSMNNYENVSRVNSLDAHAFFAKPLNARAFEAYILGNEKTIGG